MTESDKYRKTACPDVYLGRAAVEKPLAREPPSQLVCGIRATLKAHPILVHFAAKMSVRM